MSVLQATHQPEVLTLVGLLKVTSELRKGATTGLAGWRGSLECRTSNLKRSTATIWRTPTCLTAELTSVAMSSGTTTL